MITTAEQILSDQARIDWTAVLAHVSKARSYTRVKVESSRKSTS